MTNSSCKLLQLIARKVQIVRFLFKNHVLLYYCYKLYVMLCQVLCARGKYAMGIETHDFSFSADQPETLLKPLLALLQPGPDQSKTGTSRSAYLLESQSILIIDSDRIRANTVAQFVNVAGYRSVIAETALEAFTLFLKVVYIPKFFFLGHDSPP